jgi:hypothetical protein
MTTFDGLIARYSLQLKRQGQELVGPCPRCGGTDRFAINPRKGVWNCRGCQRGGGAIELVRHLEGCSYQDALDILAVPCTRGADHLRRHVDRQRHADHAQYDNVLAAQRIWKASSPLGPEAIAYFDQRGIDIDAVPDHGGLRFHPNCPWESGSKPCVVARYTMAIGNEPRGIWRRPIDGGKPKALGPTSGCVIRLWPDDAVEGSLVIAEGIETTLAAATRIEHRGTLLQPAWAAGSASNMASFPVLSGVEALTLLIDNDANDAGQRAGEECCSRWQVAGAEVTLLTPTILDADFNNVVLR